MTRSRIRDIRPTSSKAKAKASEANSEQSLRVVIGFSLLAFAAIWALLSVY